uniref:NTR domain-containing protein n=1 Tax=Parastrongyloides trichosuri TaxID=131310 RepID=A0A0N4ZL68_PARTI
MKFQLKYIAPFFIVFLFKSISINGQDCSCNKVEKADIYCTSKWIADVRVTSQINSKDGEAYYNVQVSSVLKEPKNKKVKQIKKIISKPPSPKCGPSLLKKGVKYLLSGGIDKKGNLFIDGCRSTKLNQNRGDSFSRIKVWKKWFECKKN